MENFQFSDQNHELTPLEKSQFLNIFIVYPNVFLPYNIIKYIFLAFFLLKLKKWKILNFFNQNHGKTSLEKSQIFYFFKSLFLYSKQGFFLSRISSNTFSWPILPKIETRKNFNFGWPYWIFPKGLTHGFGSKL